MEGFEMEDSVRGDICGSGEKNELGNFVDVCLGA